MSYYKTEVFVPPTNTSNTRFKDCNPALLVEVEKITPIEQKFQLNEVFKRYTQLLEHDRATYKFKCERYGDFLAVFVTRGVKKHDYWEQTSIPNKFVGSINIGTTKQILLNPGLDVTLDGINYPSIDWRTLENESYYDSAAQGKRVYASICVCYTPRPEHWNNEYLLGSHLILTLPPKENNVTYGGDSGGSVTVGKIEKCARPARDDTISFERNGTLHIPFGLGEQVYAQILKEIQNKGDSNTTQ